MEMKLGKLPAKIDKRTILLKAIIRKELLPELPDSHNIDEALGGIKDDRVFNNKKYGDCVIAARAHQTLRLEKYEQGFQPPITDQEVIGQYFKETGGLDIGLYLLDSLKEWRKNGWVAGGKTYTIYAFASVDWKDHDEVKHCIHLLGGVNFGMLVPQSALDQFEAEAIWEVVEDDGGNQGGHGVYLYHYGTIEGYDERGITCMTWGRRQFMTWEFFDRYVDEAYGIVDNVDPWLGEDSPVDVEKLNAYLEEITEGRGEGESACKIAKLYAGLGNFVAKLLGRKSRVKAIIPKG